MKQITLFLLLFISGYVYSQSDCSSSQTLSLQADATETVSSNGVSGTAPTSTCNTNYYSASEVSAGAWYEFSLAQDQEVTVISTFSGDFQNDYVPSFSVYEGSCGNLTCIDGSLITVDANNNLQPAEVQFSATANTTYYIAFDNYYANIPAPNGPLGTTSAFSFDVTTESCTDSAPGLATNPNPADGASNVTITTNADGNTQVTFGWSAPTFGPVNDYLFVVSEDPGLDPNDNSTISGTFDSTGPFPIFLPDPDYFTVSTTYYWAAIPQNCAGQPSSDPTIWSFTTDNTLSAEDFEEAVSFEFFLNNGRLNISANQNFDQINIYDLSGKQVMNRKLSSNDENISIQSLAKGLYLAKVQIGNQTKTFKFIK